MILIVSLTPSTGGAEKYLQNLEGYYSNNIGCKVAFIDNNGINTTKFNKNNIVLRGSRNRFIGIIKFFIFWIKNINKFDRLYSTHISVNAIVGFMKIITLSNIVIVSRESTSVFLRFSGVRIFIYKLVYNCLYKKNNLVICQTELMKSQLMNSVSLSDDKILVLQNPFSFNKISHAKVILDGDINIVTAGRLIHEKGFDILIDSFSLLYKKFKNVHLYILGEGIEREKLENQINDFNLKDNIHLKGFESNPLSFFSAADLCVVSSRKEGFPNVLLEMLSVNNNVIITPCCGDLEGIPKLLVTENISKTSIFNSMYSKLKNLDTTISTKKIIREYLDGLDISIFVKKINTFLKHEFKQ